MSDPWVPVLLGSRFGDLDVREHLGSGSFGHVFRAEHAVSRDQVAIKVLIPSPRPESAVEFNTEVILLRKLERSARVVTVLGDGVQVIELDHLSGITVPLSFRYVVLELAEASLEQLILRRDSLDWMDRIRLWRHVVLGVHQMHLKQVVHRDLKSSNCLVFRHREGYGCKVADLGRSRDLAQLARHGPIDYLQGMGDLRFAPPEFLWAQGEDSPRGHMAADFYGLGSLLFELATGVGLTSVAVRPDLTLLNQNMAARQQGLIIDLSSLRGRYFVALESFSRVAPVAISGTASRLMKRLCDPVPELRTAPGPFRNSSDLASMAPWVLRMADIMIKQLVVARRETRRRLRKESP